MLKDTPYLFYPQLASNVKHISMDALDFSVTHIKYLLDVFNLHYIHAAQRCQHELPNNVTYLQLSVLNMI